MKRWLLELVYPMWIIEDPFGKPRVYLMPHGRRYRVPAQLARIRGRFPLPFSFDPPTAA